jgi:hypothetical protein
MVKRLLALRPDVYDDYTPARFEQLLGARTRIVAKDSLAIGDRVLFAYTSA